MARTPNLRLVPGYGDELRARLKTASMTQVDLANAAEISRQTLIRALREDRVSAQTEAAIDEALARAGSGALESRFRPPAGWARATDLAQWADRREAQSDFPDIVRGLVRLTGGELSFLQFRAGEGVQIEGWDGHAIAGNVSPFIPLGESVWEIGTTSRIAEKADADFEKRRENPLGIDPSNATYVFVTPRRWPKKKEWVDARKRENFWKDVRVLDADDVEQWLQDAPSVHLRLSRLVGTLPDAAHDLQYWWENWSKATRPALSEEFVLAGRRDQANTIQRALAEPGTLFGVRAESRLEAIAAVAAAMKALPAELADDYVARAIVVEDSSAWRALVSSRTRLILIPLVDVGDAAAAAIRAGHNVVLPLSPGDVDAKTTISLPPVDRAEAAAAIIAAGPSGSEEQLHKKADSLARLARRSMTALRRHLAVASQLQSPAWARPENARRIVPALLPGGWNSSSLGDRNFVQRVAGKNYIELVDALAEFTNGVDPVLRRRDSLWYLVSREDAWKSLVPFCDDEDVERFRIAATEALTLVHPQFDMPKDERWMAGVSDKKASHSAFLLKAIAETLALTGARMDSENRDDSSGVSIGAPSLRHLSDRVVREVLRAANNDWRVWASLSGLLPDLAEAAPDVFLSSVETGLRTSPSPVLELFAQESEGVLGASSPHTGLLWAFERLAWSDTHFAIVVKLLAELAQRDLGGRLANRPLEVLKAIFKPWMPQTTVSVQRRLRILDGLTRTHEATAWQVLISTLPELHGVAFNASRPAWREWELPNESVKRVDYEMAVVGAVDQLLRLTGTSGDRWAELISCIPNLGSREVTSIVEQLGNVSGVDAVDSAKISEALRELVATHRNYPDARWVMQQQLIDRLDDLRRRFGQKDLVAASAWLFTWHPQLVNPRAPRDDFHAYTLEIEEERVTCIASIAQSEGLDGILRLAAKADQPHMVGFSAAKSGLFARDERSIVRDHVQAAESYRAGFARGFAGGRISSMGSSWVVKTISDLGDALRPQQKGELLSLLETVPETWRLAAELGEAVEQAYWERAWFVRDDKHVDAAADKLIEFGQVDRAATLLGMKAHSSIVDPKRILDVLQRILRGETSPELLRSDFRHHLSAMLDRLYGAAEIAKDEIAQIEWAFLPTLEYGRSPSALHAELGRAPSFFVELVSLVFRGEDEPAKAPDQITDEQREHASRAFTVLQSWRRVPGSREDGTVDVEILRSWVQRAREALRAADRETIGDQQIGQVLSGAPSDPDGTWPCAAVRTVIEEIASSELERGFAIGKFNSQGVVSRSIGEGGRQERAAADRYERLAALIADSAPRSARLLREMATDHRRHAVREDREAELEEDLGG
jgi:hypothetical protein